MSKVSFREMKIILNQTAQAVCAFSLPNYRPPRVAVPNVISHLRFVPVLRDFLVYLGEILGRNLGKRRQLPAPNLMKIKN